MALSRACKFYGGTHRPCRDDLAGSSGGHRRPEGRGPGPLGAAEAHGPHLPLATATYLAIETAKRGARKLKAHGVRGIVFPNISYSVCERSADFPGTLSLSRATAVALLKEVAQNATRNFRAVAFVNTHLDPAHLEVLKQVIEESKKAGVSACFVDFTRKRWAQQLGPVFQKGDHAGAFETSAMMALNLPLVREHERISIPPMDGLVASMKKGMTNLKEAGGDNAYFGDPGAASIEDGETILERLSPISARFPSWSTSRARASRGARDGCGSGLKKRRARRRAFRVSDVNGSGLRLLRTADEEEHTRDNEHATPSITACSGVAWTSCHFAVASPLTPRAVIRPTAVIQKPLKRPRPPHMVRKSLMRSPEDFFASRSALKRGECVRL